MIKVLKNKKGITLIELIVGLMLFAIVTAAASAVLAPLLSVFAKVNELSECNTLSDIVANQIIGDLFNATVEIEGLEDDDDELVNEIKIIGSNLGIITYKIDTNGVLLKNDISVLSKTYYKNKSVSFSCALSSIGAEKAYILTVTVLSDKEGKMISRDYAVRPLAILENQYLP